MGFVWVHRARPNLESDTDKKRTNPDSFFFLVFCYCAAVSYEEAGRTQVPSLTKHQGAKKETTLCPFWGHLTLTGLSVAENASCRAQHASRHISSVNTGPAVTRTYLPKGMS